jgi:hypothetical protein
VRRHTWVPYVAGLAGTLLLVKGLLAAVDGQAAPDVVFAVLYLSGIALGVVAAVGAGLRRGGWPGAGLGAGLAVLLVLWIMGLGESLEAVVRALTDDRAVQEEVPIAVAGAVVLLLAWRAWDRDNRSVSAPRAA